MDKYVLFYVYGDKYDTPYIIKNPPDNLNELLNDWRQLDDKYSDGDSEQAKLAGYDYVDSWLRERGVELIEPGDEVYL
jgi:hypothetical protein